MGSNCRQISYFLYQEVLYDNNGQIVGVTLFSLPVYTFTGLFRFTAFISLSSVCFRCFSTERFFYYIYSLHECLITSVSVF